MYQIHVKKLEKLVAEKALKSRGDRESFTERTQSPEVGDTKSFTGGTESPPNHHSNRQFNHQSSSASGGQQQPVDSKRFYELRDQINPKLKTDLKDGTTLIEKFARFAVRYGDHEQSARKFLEMEKPEVPTEKEIARQKLEARDAAIEECRKLTGYGATSQQEAERKIELFRSGQIPHYRETIKDRQAQEAEPLPF